MHYKRKPQEKKCSILKKEFNLLFKEVKKAVAKDEKEFYERGFDYKMDSTKAWRTANELLGTVKNLSPTAIKHQKDGDKSPEMVTNPLKMANIFNKYFKNANSFADTAKATARFQLQ